MALIVNFTLTISATWTDAELQEQIATMRRELFGLRFQNATGELENTAGLARQPPRARPRTDDRPRARS